MKEFFVEAGNSKGQKEAALQSGTINTPDRDEVRIFLIVGMTLETGGQSQTFSLSHEWAKALISIVLGHKKSEKKRSVLAFD